MHWFTTQGQNLFQIIIMLAPGSGLLTIISKNNDFYGLGLGGKEKI